MKKNKNVFFIDQKKHETDAGFLTVRQILVEFAKVDSKLNTLAIKEQGNFRELRDLDESISMKPGLHFTIFNEEPNPVSCFIK